MLDKFFKYTERGSSLSTEVLAGITTFLTMAYIIFVNPNILGLTDVKGFTGGVPFAGAVTATCLGAAVMSILMGIFSNRPLALASGMGLNAVVAYSLILGVGVKWQVAMAVIFVEGLVILVLVLAGLREAIMNAIPVALRRSIAVGIGLFIALIGLKSGGLIVANDSTLIAFGDVTDKAVWVALIGLVVTIVLKGLKVKGDILIGIVVATIASMLLGVSQMPESIIAMPDFSTIAAPFQKVNGSIALAQVFTPTLLVFVFSILMTDFFDTMGTVVGVGEEAGFVDEKGDVSDVRSILVVDSAAAAVGGFLGASSVTTFVESASGVGDGGRTGLTVVVTGILFLLAMFFSPIIGVVSSAATAGALIVVGYLMMTPIKDIEWTEFDTAFPAFMTILTIPLTYSITNGIGLGFISYVVIKVSQGKFKDIKPLMWVAAIAFLFVFLQNPILNSFTK